MSTKHHLDHNILHAAEDLVHVLNKAMDDDLPQDIAEVVKFHAVGAATACVAAGWLPGAGALAAAGICAGFIWTMYGRINSKIGLPLADNLIKSLATGAVTNLAAGFVGSLFLQTTLTLIPGVGNVGASVIAGTTGYALTLGSGYLYLKVLTNLFASGKDPSKMDADSLGRAAGEAAKSKDVKDVMKNAKSDYKPD
jgi:uncharacterized protein (DUF697 family)